MKWCSSCPSPPPADGATPAATPTKRTDTARGRCTPVAWSFVPSRCPLAAPQRRRRQHGRPSQECVEAASGRRHPPPGQPDPERRDNGATNREGAHGMRAVLLVEGAVSSTTVTNCARCGTGGTDTATHHRRYRPGGRAQDGGRCAGRGVACDVRRAAQSAPSVLKVSHTRVNTWPYSSSHLFPTSIFIDNLMVVYNMYNCSRTTLPTTHRRLQETDWNTKHCL